MADLKDSPYFTRQTLDDMWAKERSVVWESYMGWRPFRVSDPFAPMREPRPYEKPVGEFKVGSMTFPIKEAKIEMENSLDGKTVTLEASVSGNVLVSDGSDFRWSKLYRDFSVEDCQCAFCQSGRKDKFQSFAATISQKMDEDMENQLRKAFGLEPKIPNYSTATDTAKEEKILKPQIIMPYGDNTAAVVISPIQRPDEDYEGMVNTGIEVAIHDAALRTIVLTTGEQTEVILGSRKATYAVDFDAVQPLIAALQRGTAEWKPAEEPTAE
jgi:hypothetical protein